MIRGHSRPLLFNERGKIWKQNQIILNFNFLNNFCGINNKTSTRMLADVLLRTGNGNHCIVQVLIYKRASHRMDVQTI